MVAGRILFVFFMIFGLYVFHKFFTVIFSSFTQLIISELVGAGVFALIMSLLAVFFPVAAIVILIIVGAIYAMAAESKAKQLIGIGCTVFLIVLIILASSYLNNSKENAEIVKKISGTYLMDGELTGKVVGITATENSYESNVLVASRLLSGYETATYTEEQIDQICPVAVSMSIKKINKNKIEAGNDNGDSITLRYNEKDKSLNVEKINLAEGDSSVFLGHYIHGDNVPGLKKYLTDTNIKNYEDTENKAGTDFTYDKENTQDISADYSIKSNDTMNMTDYNYGELIDTITRYYAMEHGTNNVAGELDGETDRLVTIRIYDPYTNTTSSTLGFYEYDKETGDWRDAITGDIVDFDSATEAYNYKLEFNNRPAEGSGIVNAPDGYINLRMGPGTEYEILCPIRNGEDLCVYDENTNASNGKKWQKVAYWNDGEWLTGWVIASQIEYTYMPNAYVVDGSDST